MPDPAADRNLLFGILALQMDFIGRDALIAAMHAWVLDKGKPLGQVLRAQGALSAERLALLDALLGEHLKQHGNDPGRSLAALSSVGSVRRELQQVADPDVQASLAHVSAARKDDDPFATRATTAGTPTSSGLRYSILRPHAKGGLGEVFVARDEELRREVALKEIQDRHADHPESRARFLLEAEVTGGLEHPGIVPVYGLGTYGDGRPFYAMRFIRGDSLQDAIRRFHQADQDGSHDRGQRALELRQLLGRFVDVCQAIAYAHSRGVLHRDLKPGNVMLGQYGETLVVDWGLAKALGRPEGKGSVDQGPLQPASENGSLPTQMGSALGTPAYMSPEQAAGRLDLLGAANDVYSLGATLYALLTGRVPFEGNDAGAILQRVQRGDFPPPGQVNKKAVSPALDAICRKAMALRPQDRYASAQALADDVEHWLADEPVAAYPEPWAVRAGRWARRHRTAVTGAVAAVAVAAASLTVATLLLAAANQREQQAKQKAEQKEQDATAALGRATVAKQAVQKALTDLEARQSQLARSFCEVSDREFRNSNVRDSLNWMLRAYEVAPVTDPLRASYRQLLAGQGRSVGKLLGHGGWVSAVAFSPDGRLALTGSHDGTARLWEAATGQPFGQPLRHEGAVSAVAFSPDGRLALTGSGDKTARLWDTATGQPFGQPLRHEGAVSAVAFSPDGRLALTGSYDKTARLWDVVPPVLDEPPRLSAWVHVRTGKAFNDQDVLEELSEKDWLRAWQELDANGGDWEPPPDPRRWHTIQAADAEAAKDWFAAAFHLKRLLNMAPEDSDLRRRLDTARANLRK